MQLPEGFVLDAAPQKAMPSRGRTFLEQGLAGATFNLADEAYNRLGAAGASLVTGEDYGALLNEAQGQTKQRMAEQMQERPALSIGSQLAGALLTGGAGATTKSGQALASGLRTGGLAARAGKAGALGAATGSAAGFGAGSGFEDRLASAGDSALVGGVVGGAIPVVGAVASGALKKAGAAGQILGKGINARDAEELDTALSAIKSRSSAAYQQMRDAGAVINRPRAVNLTNKVEQALRSDGKLNASLHANTLSVLEDFKNAARQGDFTLEDLDQWRQLFSQVAGNFNDPVNARKASIAIDSIDDAVDALKGIDIKGGSTQAVDALNYGRQEWARARKFERVANVIKKSDGDANYLKRELNKMITDPRKSRGFNESERAALKEAGTLSTSEAIMKMLGKFGFDAGNARVGSGVGALVGGGVAGAAGGTGAGIAAPVIGTAARYGQKLAARGKAENLLGAIEGVASNSTSGLPALIATPKAGQLAAPAGMLAPTQIMVNPKQASPYQENLPQVNLPQGFQLDAPEPQPSLKDKISGAESSNNPNAQNPNSSASGLFQFTDSTWKSSVDKWGRNKGIKYSDKNSPEKQAMMMDYLLQDNARILQKKGIEPSDANLYFAHFMGAPAASKAISLLGKNAIAARSFPDAARANKEVFFDGQRPRTIDEVYELITSKVA